MCNDLSLFNLAGKDIEREIVIKKIPVRVSSAIPLDGAWNKRICMEGEREREIMEIRRKRKGRADQKILVKKISFRMGGTGNKRICTDKG